MDELVGGLRRADSVTVDYDPGRLLQGDEWARRAALLTTVLGNGPFGDVIDLGSGIGQVSAWAAARAGQVIAFDLSHTHCLLYTFFMWHRKVGNAHVFHGSLAGLGGEHAPHPVDLLISFNALSRAAVLDQWPHVGRYLRPRGQALLAYPLLYGDADPTSEESLALGAGLGDGSGEWQPPTPPGLDLVVTGRAGKTQISLPCAAIMTGRKELFDFATGRPSPCWKGLPYFPIELEYRLYRAAEGSGGN
ncbi:MAG: hypothetical protein RDU89_03635 [bacterium]|nr:hypothetical protein [bacterium]